MIEIFSVRLWRLPVAYQSLPGSVIPLSLSSVCSLSVISDLPDIEPFNKTQRSIGAVTSIYVAAYHQILSPTSNDSEANKVLFTIRTSNYLISINTTTKDLKNASLNSLNHNKDKHEGGVSLSLSLSLSICLLTKCSSSSVTNLTEWRAAIEI